jgi:hypothetical protein
MCVQFSRSMCTIVAGDAWRAPGTALVPLGRLAESPRILGARLSPPMTDLEAPATSVNGADRSGCGSRVARDKLALHSSKDLWNSHVQVME